MDLREAGLIGSVRNQGNCSSSWAIAAAEILENLLLRDLSHFRMKMNYYGQFDNESLVLSH